MRLVQFSSPSGVYVFDMDCFGDNLPKTRSGKIMRRLLKDIAEGRELGDVTTLRDPTVTEKIREKVASGQTDE